MQRSGPTKCDEEEIRRIEPTLDGHKADRLSDIGIGDRDNRGRCFRHADSLRPGDIALDRFGGAAGVDPKGTPKEVILAEAFEHNIGVGDRRVNAADAVTRRPRLGACALRADPQQAAAVEPGEAAASGADRMHVDRGRFDR